ncbi:MAG: hypothetical protein ACI9XU_001734 [Arenicella sp.]|jgi:hypothetical protein
MGFELAMHVVIRTSRAACWTNGNRMKSRSGEAVEAPSISFDGGLLNYHKKVGGIFKVYAAEREWFSKLEH